VKKTRFGYRASFGEKIKQTYRVVGEPVDVHGAEQLAAENKFQFQSWALGLCGARPAGSGEAKKGADKGIDGRLYFYNTTTGKTEQVIFSVKGGHLKATDVRDLRGVLDREKAAIGVLISLEEPSRQMRTEAASAGFYKSGTVDKTSYPKMQLITVGELLAGKSVQMPNWHESRTFKQAPKAKGKQTEQHPLF